MTHTDFSGGNMLRKADITIPKSWLAKQKVGFGAVLKNGGLTFFFRDADPSIDAFVMHSEPFHVHGFK
jgi:hypothetical protein